MNIKTSRPMKVVAAVLATATTGERKIDTIYDFCNLSPEELMDLGSKIGELPHEEAEVLNTKIFTLRENLKDGELWQFLIISHKIEDAPFILPSLDFWPDVKKRSIDFDQTVSQILEYLAEGNVGADFDNKKLDLLMDKISDLQIVLTENAIAEGDDLKLGKVLAIFFNMHMVDNIIETSSSQTLARKVQEDFNFNYKDAIVEQMIYMLKNMYELDEDDLCDTEGGISIPKIVRALEAYM